MLCFFAEAVRRWFKRLTPRSTLAPAPGRRPTAKVVSLMDGRRPGLHSTQLCNANLGLTRIITTWQVTVKDVNKGQKGTGVVTYQYTEVELYRATGIPQDIQGVIMIEWKKPGSSRTLQNRGYTTYALNVTSITGSRMGCVGAQVFKASWLLVLPHGTPPSQW